MPNLDDIKFISCPIVGGDVAIYQNSKRRIFFEILCPHYTNEGRCRLADIADKSIEITKLGDSDKCFYNLLSEYCHK